jgi:anti-sigma regulatory factor (Ser/Thr protein kinase)
MMKTYRLTHAAELEALSVFRDFIGQICAQAGLTEAFSDDLKLSVDEACANIVNYGYAGMDRGSIILDVQLDEAQAQIEITDFGRAFEPREAPPPDFDTPVEQRRLGGFGLYFIQTVMDQVSYQAGPGGNRLTLTKRLPGG